MTAFQQLGLVLVTVLCAASVRALIRGTGSRRIALAWLAVWAAAGVAIAWPETTAVVARLLGIGRGADLLLYCTVLAGMVGFFLVYARIRLLNQHVTVLVRQLALAHADSPAPFAPSSALPASPSIAPPIDESLESSE